MVLYPLYSKGFYGGHVGFIFLEKGGTYSCCQNYKNAAWQCYGWNYCVNIINLTTISLLPLAKTMVKVFKIRFKWLCYVWLFLISLSKYESHRAGVCLISNVIFIGSFWVLNHFHGVFSGWGIRKTFFIFHWFLVYFHVFSNLKVRKT